MSTSIGVGAFKARCLRLLDHVHHQRKSFTITKRGKPIARVVPILSTTDEPDRAPLHGTLLFERDAVSPLDTTWEAAK